MAGYIKRTWEQLLPDFNMLRRLVAELNVPIIAEGGIVTPDQLKQAITEGAWCAVVGSAITRPMAITRRFVGAIT